MSDVFLVSDPTRRKLDELIRDRGDPIGRAGLPKQPTGGGGARFAFFTLPGALANTDASKASCTVGTYFGGPSPGSTITVWNPPASSNYIFSGASGNKGIAVYDSDSAKWWIVQMEC